jgi:putative ABC transport system ATP-binding protein
MVINLKNIKPTYMSEEEVSSSDIYLQPHISFCKGKKYLIKANSGHGKSSLLNFIYGSNICFEGEISYTENQNTVKEDTYNLRRNKLSYVFQDLKLFNELTVAENIMLKNNLTNYKTTEEITHFINYFNLESKKNSPVKNLSLGQRQRVAMIRALCQPFDFLLMDEPFSHLDKENSRLAAQIINREIDRQGAGLIITSLDEENVFNYDTILNL